MERRPSEISDYYERLGVSKDASRDEIQKAYRVQALKYHPDKNIGNEESNALEFVAINEAYGVLTKGDGRVINNDSVWTAYENNRKKYEVVMNKIKNSFQYEYCNGLFNANK